MSDLTVDQVRQCLDYNPDTGVFTRKFWKGASTPGHLVGREQRAAERMRGEFARSG